MNKDKTIQLLGLATKARKVIFGTDTVTKSMTKIKLLFVSKDASDNTKKLIVNKSNYYKIDLVLDLDCNDLYKACGKNIMVLGICDQGFANSLNNSLKEDVKNESI